MKIKFGLFLSFLLLLNSCRENQNVEPDAKIHNIGEMRNVMWKGELGGIVALDSLPKKALYGLGPKEGLRGELLIWEGSTYISRIKGENDIEIVENSKVRAPFFVYTNVKEWTTVDLPDSIKNLKDLEHYLDSENENLEEAFVFILSGKAQKATFHIQNLPEGSKVSSPQEAHAGQVDFELENTEVDLLGFFSRKHQGIFTHHDSYLHIHLLTKDRSKMGHLDKLIFSAKDFQLFLPSRISKTLKKEIGQNFNFKLIRI
ncbi:acetolactate decarboxylase [Salegentibacter sp. HM20]